MNFKYEPAEGYVEVDGMLRQFGTLPKKLLSHLYNELRYTEDYMVNSIEISVLDGRTGLIVIEGHLADNRPYEAEFAYLGAGAAELVRKFFGTADPDASLSLELLVDAESNYTEQTEHPIGPGKLAALTTASHLKVVCSMKVGSDNASSMANPFRPRPAPQGQLTISGKAYVSQAFLESDFHLPVPNLFSIKF